MVYGDSNYTADKELSEFSTYPAAYYYCYYLYINFYNNRSVKI